ncbi:zinc finger protein BALDIBIS-like [Andrographis paniculata]|uniref:zinc finger protein BALDIBIS-like n=1 Tax=Andrographis paniculata TaxID=175694 RepID=UPI0021E95CCE|nr:zinc finger protein BALDIBIS-like [Andrographis paniculata]
MSGDVFSSTPISSAPPTAIFSQLESEPNPNPNPKPNSAKKKRSLPGTPDPDAEVIALSPKTLMATNRFICEICNKGFQRDQNLQLHRRGHNLPWRLKQRANKDQIRKKVYICPEKTCVHHDAGRALGDLTGIKKHFSRKHGEKKWKCEKCSKKYAVQSDWKAHSKTCGTREYKCDCGTLFSRKDSFITHRAFCDALAEENARITTIGANNLSFRHDHHHHLINPHPNLQQGLSNTAGIIPAAGGRFAGNLLLGDPNHHKPRLPLWLELDHHTFDDQNPNLNFITSNTSTTPHLPDIIHIPSNNLFGPNYANLSLSPLKEEPQSSKGIANSTAMADSLISLYSDTQSNLHPPAPAPPLSATALLQQAAQLGSTKSASSPFLGGASAAVGVMNSSNSPSSSSSTTNTLSTSSFSRSELHQVFAQQQPPPENNPATKSADDLLNFSAAIENSNLHHFQQQSAASAGASVNAMNLNLHSGLMHGVEHSFTRDFLGMGGDGGGGGGAGAGPYLSQELAKLASMSSAMGLSHYTVNH